MTTSARMFLTAALAIGLTSSSVLIKTGCNEDVKDVCTTGLSSVCLTTECPNSSLGGDDFKKAVLDIHNHYRMQAYTNGSYGGDMMLLTWDVELANAANGHAQTLCIGWDKAKMLSHDSYDCRVTESYSFVGQNLAYRAGTAYTNDTASAIDSVTSWYNEIKASPADKMFPYSSNPSAGHYTQVMWSRSYRVGCALVKRPWQSGNEVWVACNYAPGGNLGGMAHNVFNPSRAVASECRSSSAKGSSGLCEVTDEAGYRSSVGLIYTPPRFES